MGESSMKNEPENDTSGSDIRSETIREGIALTAPPSVWSGWLPRVLTGVGILALMIIICYATARMVQPQVVTFDMKGTMDIFLQQSSQQNLDEAGAKKLVTRFSQAMRDSLAGWQSQHNAIILVSPAVVSVQTDITTDIRNDIAARMQEGK